MPKLLHTLNAARRGEPGTAVAETPVPFLLLTEAWCLAKSARVGVDAGV